MPLPDSAVVAPEAVAAPPVRRSAPVSAGRAGVVAVSALAIATGLAVALHVLGWGRIDPVGRTISDYALLPWGAALFALTMGFLLVASLALWVGTHVSQALTSPPRALFVLAVLWCVGLFLVAAFPTDPPGAPLTPPGAVHRYAAGLVFFTLPPLARILARLFARQGTAVRAPGLDAAARRLSVLSVVSWWCLALFLLSHLPVVLPHTALAQALAGPYAVLGLAERLLLAVDLAILLVLGRALLARPARRRGSSRRDREETR